MVRNTLLAGLVGLAASVASADIASFGFTDLNGSFDATNMVFTAVAFTGGLGSSSGDVTRFAEGGGATAEYGPGFFGGGSLGNVVITIDITNVVGSTADGSGSFTITDADGDIITGDVTGQWFAGAFGFVFMNGATTNITFDRNGVGNGTFDGPNGGSFDSDSLASVYYGALSILLRTPTGVGFFTDNFAEVSTQADGLIVPSPASIALAGLGLGIAGYRRRR
ncbi:MAG: hypothetical protein KF757_13420 [Phycisphaeraceae bacterium]|nr:hypothetical protein [Phycisphaeraceae bacterium]MCW5763962.1 hypothetical protein [Phycisphaeraceae bacterium]